MLVVKRDGSNQEFDEKRIIVAVEAAMRDIKVIDKHFAENVSKVVCDKLKGRSKVLIDEITSLVEDTLMASRYKAVARSYIEYRHDRDNAREQNSDLYRNIDGLMGQTDVSILNENANKDSKIIPTQRDLLAGIVSKHIGLTKILPRDVANAHIDGDIHYHDLDYAPFFPMWNCCLIHLEGMLANGFRLGNAEIESPHSITTACAITAQIIAQVASHIYGGNTISRIDEVLAPYVTKSYEKHLAVAEEWNIQDKEAFARQRTEVEVEGAIQGLEYEINTLQCANGQTPFTTLNFGLGTSWESRTIQKAIFKVRIKGLGKNGHTAVFPKLVYTIKEGINRVEGDVNYDIKKIAVECATKRMYPDILNYDKNVEVTGSFKPPMGCRSFLSAYTENGVQVTDGRNNLGVISLNLPRIAIESKGDFEQFEKILDERLVLCKKALMTRIKRFEGVKARVAPILYMEGVLGVRMNPDDEVLDLFRNGRATISLGYIGLHEVMTLMFPDVHPQDSAEAQAFAKHVLERLREACDEWKNETGFGFGLYGTPSENLCDRFARLDVKKFGTIPEVNDKGYYTNSFHLDVYKKTTPHDKLDFESFAPSISSGGHICYTEYPSLIKNPKALEDMWDYSYDVVPYYSTNTPVDKCHVCKFEGEFTATSKGYHCPKCGNTDGRKMNVIRRVCGYLGECNHRPFNEGKQNEVQRRVKHLDNSASLD